MIKQLVLAAQIALASFAALAQDAIGTITILEGAASVYRGEARVNAAEGVRLFATDIIEMGDKGFMQVEFPDKSVLQMGPRSRAMLNAFPARSKPERSIYAIEGWFKLSSDRRDAKGGPGLDLRSPRLDIPAQEGALVVKIGAAEVAVFAEVAESKLVERQASGAQVAVALKLGDLYQRKGTAKGAVNSGSRTAFLHEVPRAFQDSLPSRIDRFRGRAVTPRAGSEFVYADVEPWLKSDPALRKQFVERWRAKASDQAFRSALIANLKSHPEWEPILFPEKSAPKRPEPPPVAVVPKRPDPPPVAKVPKRFEPPPVAKVPKRFEPPPVASRAEAPNTAPAAVQSLPPPFQ